ncbi:hypothetical protein K438DRAFT_1957354 [Mycena galopus ATCC 62051]|nr:hypothetical protein K438DRAFT_1957354 [Mycena galopus ATCC 62051]
MLRMRPPPATAAPTVRIVPRHHARKQPRLGPLHAAAVRCCLLLPAVALYLRRPCTAVVLAPAVLRHARSLHLLLHPTSLRSLAHVPLRSIAPDIILRHVLAVSTCSSPFPRMPHQPGSCSSSAHACGSLMAVSMQITPLAGIPYMLFSVSLSPCATCTPLIIVLYNM